jgi:hypothetical protein
LISSPHLASTITTHHFHSPTSEGADRKARQAGRMQAVAFFFFTTFLFFFLLRRRRPLFPALLHF